MTPQQRSLTMLGVIVAAMVLFGAWYALQPADLPDGYEFPRHTLTGGGPDALYEGVLTDLDGCIRADEFLVIWPSGYSLTLQDAEPVVNGEGRAVGMGEPIRLGGGYYEDGPPDVAADVLEGTCSGPYFLTTGFVD